MKDRRLRVKSQQSRSHSEAHRANSGSLPVSVTQSHHDALRTAGTSSETPPTAPARPPLALTPLCRSNAPFPQD
eukprot:1559632-Rhodomonas_salina.1